MQRSPWDQRRRLWWLLWSRCPGIGWKRVGQLEAAFGTLEAAWRGPSGALLVLPGWSAGLLDGVVRYRDRLGPDPLAGLLQNPRADLGVLVPGDPRWPRGLRGLSRPPMALYWSGNGSLWSHLQRRRAVAVVGTRRASIHGLRMARRLGGALARAGWPVVSGLAEGIDAAAHGGCLEREGRPVGVLGTPLERTYPRHHETLQRQVGACGLLISEQARGTSVRGAHFALRNRLQVSLSAAVVVVECPEGSGALHSAELAWMQELPLWVVPADADKRSAAGSNRLLARGATPLIDPADLTKHLGPGPLFTGSAAAASPPSLPHRAFNQRNGHQSHLMAAVGSGACLEHLSRALDRPQSELMPELLQLELSGQLVAEPGLRWRPC